MSQEKKKREDAPILADDSPPVEESPSVDETPKSARAKAAPVKSSTTLVLTGAASYANMVLNVGPFFKGKPFKVDENIAKALLETGFFERV